MAKEKIIWQITIIECDGKCNYSINIEDGVTVINLYLTSFSRINEYRAMALQALKSYKFQRFKVV